MKAREGFIGPDEFLRQILARAQLVKQRLPVGCCVPLSLRQLAETDAPAGILRLERDAVVPAHKGVKGCKIALRQVQPAAADKLREIFQECYLFSTFLQVVFVSIKLLILDLYQLIHLCL